MEGHLKKLHKAIESMVNHRKDLASTSTSLANSMALLGKCECAIRLGLVVSTNNKGLTQ